MTLSPYPAYADTDLPWLPKIPKHWEVKRLKQVADVAFSSVDKHSKEDEQSVLLCNYVDVYKNEHITRALEFMQATASSDEIKRFTLREGDVMITKDSESWNDIAVPAYVSEDLDNVLCGYHLALLRPKWKEMDGRFLFRALQARPMSYQFEVEATGITRYGIDQYAISSTFFPVPPLPEQRRIAAYLDRQTAKIDALIAKKQRLLDLLTEQRAALISQAVTKGLNPAVKLKDSGVAWLGQVPSHWEIKKLKFLLSRIIDNRGRTPPFGETGIPMLEIRQITEGNRYPSKSFEKFVEESVVAQYERDKVKEGDILISTVGATSGRAVLVAENPNYFIAQNVIGARPTQNITSIFLYYAITSAYFISSLNSINKANTIDNLKVSIFVNNFCVIPPLDEQKEITDYLDQQTKRLSDLATKVEIAIERLQEYRAALISSVVTGKVDVRKGDIL